MNGINKKIQKIKLKNLVINSYAFLESATFKSFQQKVKVKKETLGGLI
nr:phage replisome organiser protein [Lactococcus lactis]